QIAQMKTPISSGVGLRVGWKTADSPAAIGSHIATTTNFQAGEVGEVVVEDVHRLQQVAREASFADAVLPERRAEDDVHVPDERPDDVVRGELAGRDPVYGSALVLCDRRPHDEVDDRLGDHAEHVEVVR